MFCLGQNVLMKSSDGQWRSAQITELYGSNYVVMYTAGSRAGATKNIPVAQAHHHLVLPGAGGVAPAAAAADVPERGGVWKKPCPGVTCPHFKQSTQTWCPNLPQFGSQWCSVHAPMHGHDVNAAIPARAAAGSIW